MFRLIAYIACFAGLLCADRIAFHFDKGEGTSYKDIARSALWASDQLVSSWKNRGEEQR